MLKTGKMVGSKSTSFSSNSSTAEPRGDAGVSDTVGSVGVVILTEIHVQVVHLRGQQQKQQAEGSNAQGIQRRDSRKPNPRNPDGHQYARNGLP
jgi:hypothetical protein